MSNNTNRSSLTQIEGKTGAYAISPVSVGSSWKSLSIGSSHAVAIKNDGTLWSWGSNQYGQVGNNTVSIQSSPVQIGTRLWLSASAGANHSMAIRSDGLLFGWGQNSSYQLGNNGLAYSNYWRMASPGYSHTMLIKADGTLWAVGGNTQGQLGNNTVAAVTSPIQIGTSSWSMVTTSTLNTFAIDINGRLFAWGYNLAGDLGLNDVTNKSSPTQIGTSLWTTVATTAGSVSANDAGYAIDINKNLFAWGFGTNGQLGDNTIVSKSSPVFVGANFIKVAATDGAAVAIDGTGNIFTWGKNDLGQLGQNDTISRSAPSQIPSSYVWSNVVTAQNTMFGLTNTGLLLGWGQNTAGIIGDSTNINRSAPVQIMTNVSKLSSKNYLQTSVIDTSGSLWMWGDNTGGQLGDGTTISRSAPVQIGNSKWAAVTSTISGTLGVTTDNKLWAWGKDSGNYELYFTTSDALAATYRSSPVQTGAGLLSDSPVQIGTSSWVSVSAGTDHTLAIRSDKTLWAWGSNLVGQLIAPQFAGQLVSSPTQVGTSSYVTVSAGNSFSLAITSDNKLISAGNNTNNQLGSSTFSNLNTWSKVVESTGHALAISSDGKLFAWGDNTGGQLGDGTTISRSSPVQIGTDTWTNISINSESTTINLASSFAIRADGKLFAWGNNANGQLGQNDLIAKSSPVQVGAGKSFVQVSVGPTFHVVAIDSVGSLWAWGFNTQGQLGTGDTIARSSPVQINSNSWLQVAAGYSYASAIRSDGMLFAWGGNIGGQLGLNDIINRSVMTQIGTSSWSQVFTVQGTGQSGPRLALRSDGTLWGSGYNANGQLGDGTLTNRSSPVQVGTSTWSKVEIHNNATIGIQQDGSLWFWGVKAPVAGSDNATASFTYSWTQVAGGSQNSYAIRADSTLWGWGYNIAGQVGDNTTASRSAPVQITIGSALWKDVTGGGSFAVAINSQNRLFAWGKNDQGQLGINHTNNASSPVQIAAPLSSFSSVNSGYYHSLAIDTAGKLWSWGSNSFRQLGLTDSAYSYLSWSQVSTSASHSMFIRSDGRLFGVGYNGYGALGDGTVVNKSSPVIIGSEKWIDVSAGQRGDGSTANYTIAIRNDGMLFAWGYNLAGELGDITTISRSSPVQLGTSSWIAVASGTSGNYAIRNDNMLFAWGGDAPSTFSGGPVRFYASSSPVQVSTKPYSKIFANPSGSPGSTPITGAYALALDTDNKLWAWGNNSVGQMGRLTYDSWTSVAITNNQSRTMFGIKEDGVLYAWGTDLQSVADYTQTYNGPTLKSSPIVVGNTTPMYTKFASVSGGYSHMYAISTDGKLYGMGVPNVGYGLPDVYSWSQIRSTGITTYAIRNDGLMFAWGRDDYSQMGDFGTVQNRSAPIQIGTLSWSQLATATGQVSSMAAITSDGRLFAWGYNNQGQLGLGDTNGRQSPVQLGVGYSWRSAIVSVNSHVYMRDDGVLFGSGSNTNGVFAAGAAPASLRSSPVQISSTNYNSVVFVAENSTSTTAILAIDKNQNLFTWGSGLYGMLGDGTTINRSSPLQIGTSKWQSVAAGNRTAAAITVDGRLFTWGGDAAYYTLGSNDKSWRLIYSAGSTTFGIDYAQRLWTWGAGSNGISGTGTTTSRSSPVQIGTSSWALVSGSGEHALATTFGGGLWTWGRNIFGALGSANTVDRSSPVQISSASFPVIVAGPYQSSAAIDSLNQLWTWGSNGGVLGDGTTINRSQPVQITGTWADVSIGNSVMYAIRSDRTLWTWGLNTSGQLGLNNANNYSSPVQIGTSSWLMVSAGSKNFVAAIDVNNRLFTWGANVEGELGDNTTVSKSSPVLVSSGTAGAIAFTGSSSIASTSNINLGAGLFTVEGWFYRTSAVGSNTSFWGSTNGTGSTPKIIFNQMNTGELRVWQNDAAVLTTSTTLVPQNTWVHIAVVRDTVAPGAIKIYVNGQLQPSTTNPSGDYSGITGTFNIGADGEGAYSPFPGSISNFRVVTGVAVYTGNFTVPTNVLTTSQSSGTNISSVTDSQTQLLAYASTANDASIYGRTLTLTNASTTFSGPFNERWLQAVANNGSVFARRIDNSFWVWGNNTGGELGLNDAIARSSPVQLSAFSKESIVLNNITIQPSIGNNNTVLYNNGAGLMWGYNAAGGIGDNTTVNKSNPVQIAPDPSRSSPVQVGTDYWTQVVGGAYHFIGQQTNGKLYAWGNNAQGQLGTGDIGFRGNPTLISNTLYSSVQLSAGVSSTYMKSTGKLYSWGGNNYGEMAADNSTIARSSITQVATNSVYTLQQFFNGSSYTQVASYNHTGAIKDDGTLWLWGRNNNGQLGDLTVVDNNSPVQIAGSWTQIEVGYSTTMALKTDGTLWVWGNNSYGQLGQGHTVARSSPVQVAGSWNKIAATGNTVFAIRTTGTLWAWGNNTYGVLGLNDIVHRSSPVQVAGSWTNITALGDSIFGVKTDNTLFAWGDNSSGQLGVNDLINRSSPVQVANAGTTAGAFILPKSNPNQNGNSGVNATSFIKDNVLYTIGNNVQGQLGFGAVTTASSPVQVGTFVSTYVNSPIQIGTDSWSQVSAGTDHAAAISPDGRLFTWGGNGSGQLGGGGGEYLSISTNGNSSTNSSGSNYGFTGYVRSDGTLMMVGFNGGGQLGQGTTGNTYSSPVQVGATGYWKQVSVGAASVTLAIDYLGRLWAWGYNVWSNLGTNDSTNYSSPVLIAATNSWVQVATATRTSYAIDTAGRLWAWGTNTYGGIGDGTTINKSSPVQIGTGTDWKAVYNGAWSLHVHAIKNDGTLWAWGYNANGRLGDGTTAHKSSPVQIPGSWTMVSHNGEYYTEGWDSYGVKTDGTLWTWGFLATSTTPVQRSNASVTSWLGVYGYMYGAFALASDNYLYYMNGNNDANTYFNWSGAATGVVTQPVALSTSVSFKNINTWQNFRLGQIWPTPDNKLYVWGDNSSGLLGQNDQISRSSPIQLGANPSAFTPAQVVSGSWNQVKASSSHTVAIKNDSTLYAWGLNASGQLGTGDTVSRSSPVQLPSNTNAYVNSVQFSSGNYTTVPYNAAFLLSASNFTIEAWIYPTTTSVRRGIVNNWYIGGEFYFEITTGNNLIFGYTNVASGISTPEYTGSTTINSNVWTHVAIVRNGSAWRFYINGVADATTYTSSDTMYYYNGTTKPLLIGVGLDYSAPFTGKIAGLRIVKGVAVYTGNFTVPTIPAASTQSSGTNISAITAGQTILLTNQTIIFADTSSNNWTVTPTGSPAIVPASEIYTGLSVQPLYQWSVVGKGSGYINSVVRNDGTLWSTGLGSSGQIANGTTTTYSSYVSVGSTTVNFNAALTKVDDQSYTVAAAGFGQSLAIRNDGTLWGWGLNSQNQLGFGPGEVWTNTTGGTFQAAAMTSLGRLFTWGANTWGSVGDGTTTARATPQLIPSLISWTQMSASGDSMFAIKADGTLWVWGANYNGQLGLGDTVSRSSPVQLGSSTNWTNVSANKVYVTALNSLGQLWAWGANSGSNSTGSLGDGTTIDRSSPVQVAGSWSILGTYDAGGSVSATTYAIKPDGTMYAWGNNGSGQFGDSTVVSRSQPTQIGIGYSWSMVGCTSQSMLALRSDGTLWVTGVGTNGVLGTNEVIARSSPVQIGTSASGALIQWKSIGIGTSCAAAIRANDNSLWAWGYNLNGALGDGTVVPKSSPVQIGQSQWLVVSGLGFGLHGITIDNTLFGWGGSYTGNGTTISSSSPVAVDSTGLLTAPYTLVSSPTQIAGSWNKVSTGYHHTLAIKADGTLWAWGSNSEGQLGTITNMTLLNHGATSFVKADNTLWTWGNNASGQVGDVTLVSRSSPVQVFAPISWNQISDSYEGGNEAGGEMGRVGVDAYGYLYAWGKNTYGQLGTNNTTGYSTPQKIGVQQWKILATPFGIKEDGTLWAWGSNGDGRLGDGTTLTRSSPVQIGLSSWMAVSSNGHAIRVDGTLWGWGENSKGGIGDNTTVNKSSPVQIGTLTNWRRVNANKRPNYREAGFAINSLGQTFGFGENTFGQVGDNTTINRSSPVQIGTTASFVFISSNSHSLAIDNLGRLYGWGYNSNGQVGNGAGGPTGSYISSPVQIGTSSWITVAAGFETSYGITVDGTLFAWGNAGFGALGTGDIIKRSVPTQVGTDTWKEVAGTSGYTGYAVKSDNSVWWWGAGPSTSSPVQISSAASTNPYLDIVADPDNGPIYAITNSKTLVTLTPTTTPFDGGIWTSAVSIIGYNAAIRDDKTLWMWGANTLGQLGDGTTINRSSPVQVPGSWNFISGNGQSSNGWTAGIKTDGTLWIWGMNYNGYFGDDTSTGYRSSPVQLGTNSWITLASSGVGTLIAIDASGKLFAWGSNAYGQLGLGDQVTRSSPVQVMAGRSFTQVAANYYASYALETTGTLWAMGVNTAGYLGDNTVVAKSSPIQVNASSWATIAATGLHAMGSIIVDGVTTLWTWGGNTYGQLGLADKLISGAMSSPVQIGAVYDSDRIRYSSPVQVGLGYSWINVSAGPYASVAARQDGTVWTWGMNLVGQLGVNDVKYRSSPVQVAGTAAGSVVSLNLPKQISMNGDPINGADTSIWIQGRDGGLYTNGYNLYGQVGNAATVTRSSPVQIATTAMGTSPIVPINITSTRGSSFVAVGHGNAVAAIASNGTLWAWGTGTQGQLGYNTNATTSLQVSVGNNPQSYKVGENSIGASSWSQISAGYNHALAIDSTNRLFGWGNYAAKNPIVTSTMSWKSFINDTTTIALRSDGTLWVWGYGGTGSMGDNTTVNKSSPTQVGTDTWNQISNGSNQVGGIKTDGTLWLWGYNPYGQLGDNTVANRSSPVQVAGSWLSLSCGLNNTAAIKTDGTLWLWGDNTNGVLGDNTIAPKSSPVNIGSRATWKKAVLSSTSSYAIDNDGNLYAWGQNTNGELGLNDTVNRSSPVQVGTSKWINIAAGLGGSGGFALALRADNTLWGWGYNFNGSVGDSTGISRSSPVQVGTSLWSSVNSGPFYSSSFATDINGRLFAWGYNSTGTVGNSTTVPYQSPVLVNASYTLLGVGNGVAANDPNGLLYAWGTNTYGNYGDYSAISYSSPVLVVTNTISPNTSSPVQLMSGSWSHVNAGNDVNLVADSNGTLYTWGRNDMQQLGLNSTNRFVTSPVVIGTQTRDTGAGNNNSGYIKNI
jgi:alpha-tubulin suppressor-like RCC1 family protein